MKASSNSLNAPIKKEPSMTKANYPYQSKNGEYMRYKVLMTPAMAQRLLENYAALLAVYGLLPRALNQAKVQRYAKRMKASGWVWGISPIHLAANGAVLNGWHRLHAIVLADVSVTIDVFENTPNPEIAYMQFDPANSSRSNIDLQTMAGEEDPSIKATVLPMIVAYLNGNLKNSKVAEIDGEEMAEILNEHRTDIEEAIEFAKGADYKVNHLAFFHFIANRADVLDKVMPFLKCYKNGYNITEKTALAHLLRKKIVTAGRHLRNKALLTYFFFCLNAIIDGKTPKQLRPDSSYRLSDGPKPKTKAAKASGI
jgi:hypothetical protein